MITRLGLSLALFTLTGLLSGPADACSNPINPTLSRSTIDTAAFHREFIVSGCADDVPAGGLPIVFGFHGGGERLHDKSGSGFLDFTGLSALHALVIVPVGNVSNNGHSWINAFPWMKPSPENDLGLPAALIDWIESQQNLPRTDLRRVYALGKSDGAGMSMALACHRDPRVNLVGVALVSGAYFGLESATNFGLEDHEICLPELPVRMMMMHGTGDQVMPYAGQNFLNQKALAHADDYWTSIDPTARLGSGWLRDYSRTYTADIARYVAALASRFFHCAGLDESPFGSATTLAVGRECNAPFQVLTVAGGNHVWPGHAMSGPDSGQYPNMDFDATAVIARFFSIPMSAERPQTSTHDLNGDSKSDIVWRDTTGDVGVWLMNGAVPLSTGAVSPVSTAWSIVGQRDFDGDGMGDLLWRDGSGDNAIWFMNGTQVASTASIPGLPVGWTVVGTGDFNGDGFGDILWEDNNGNLAVWLMSGPNMLSAGSVGAVPQNLWTVAGVGDFNGDGRADILWRDTSGNTSMWFMNGTAIASTASLGNVPTTWSVVGTGDFNGDGVADIAWRDSSGNVAIWLMNGATVLATGGLGNVATSWSMVQTGDYNGDGMSDFLWRDTIGNTAMWFMNGPAAVSSGGVGGVPGTWSIVGQRDFNGDGKYDLLWRDTGGNTAMWFMNGTTVASVGNLGTIPTSWTVQSINAE
jgi:poly(3-hydroxybutyrate) depolymerase